MKKPDDIDERIKRISVKEFWLLAVVCFETTLGFKKSYLLKEASKNKSTAHPASNLWKTCCFFADNPDLKLLNESSIHDIMFSIQLAISVNALKEKNNIPAGFLKLLKKDKKSFYNRAYEAQILSYFINTGHTNATLVTSDGNPDIRIPLGDNIYYVECKKINTETQDENTYLAAIEQNYQKACSQIRSAGMGGIFIEVDNRFPGLIINIEKMLTEIWAVNAHSNIKNVIITWWDRVLYKNPNGKIYAARRHAKNILNSTAGKIETYTIPKYEGETIEYIDVAFYKGARFSTIARSDDYLKVTQANFLDYEKFVTFGKEETL